MVTHGLTETDGGEEVVVIVFKRHLNRFADSLQAGKVNGTVDVVLLEDTVQSGAVTDVLLVERDGFSGDLLNALDGFGRGINKVIDDDDVEIFFQKFNAGVAADVSGAAGDKYGHGKQFLLSFFNQSNRVSG